MQKAADVHGILQDNGDFLFLVADGNRRKFVRTTYRGVFITAGIYGENFETLSTHTWYRVVNFTLNIPKNTNPAAVDDEYVQSFNSRERPAF